MPDRGIITGKFLNRRWWNRLIQGFFLPWRSLHFSSTLKPNMKKLTHAWVWWVFLLVMMNAKGFFNSIYIWLEPTQGKISNYRANESFLVIYFVWLVIYRFFKA